ncbi:hypothetical protein [Ekhidna sp.]|uniref:hypothetical protein n=1 Tax=Ekhidna sp. TaxID=2608089 RepID=UPI00329707EB
MKITSFWLSLSLIIYGCSNSSETSIDCSSSGLSVEVINSQKSDCDVPGFLDVAGQGGELPYRYSLDGIEFQESERFEDLFAGSYTITIIDSKGCSSQTNFNLASEPTGITLTLSSSNANCSSANGSIMADASGGTGNLSYAIENGSFSNTNNFMNLSAGEYEVSVKDEENCIVTKKTRVKTNTSLSNDIMPIISSNCSIFNCHNGTVSPNLTSGSAVIDNAQRIKSETQTGSMPRNGTLSNVDIALIACWVDDGAGDN